MQNEKTQKYAKKITVKCDIEEMSNLHDTIEELKKKLDDLTEHVKYMPNGEGYEDAKMEFEQLQTHH
jgi:enoyl-[acyl-carrier-protein] reductase (NADH)